MSSSVENNLTVLITGAHGYLGALIIAALRARGITCVAYDRAHPELPEGPFSVIHAAGLTPHSFPDRLPSNEEFLEANVEFTRSFLASLSGREVQKFVHLGSIAECGFSPSVITEETPEHPDGVYGESKYAQGQMVRAYAETAKVPVVHLRIFNVAAARRLPFGEVRARCFVFESLLDQYARSPQAITVRNAEDVRDYVDAADVVEAVSAALTAPSTGYELVHIASGVGTSLTSLVSLFDAELGRQSIVKSGDGASTHSVGSRTKAKRVLGWEPKVSLSESVRSAVRSRPLVVIAGAGVAGKEVLTLLRKEKNLGALVLGFVDDDAKKVGTMVGGVPVLGTLSELPRLVSGRGASQVIISAPSSGPEVVAKVAKFLPSGFPIKVLPSISSVLLGNVDLSYVRDLDPSDLIGRPLVKADQERIAGAVRGKRFVVTGGAGSIGSEVVRQLTAAGASAVVAVDAWEEGVFNLLEEHREHGVVSAAIGNVRDRERMRELLTEAKPDVIIHAAAYKHVPLMEANAEEARKTNEGGTQILLELAAECRVPEFVLVSTDKAVNPSSVMGKTKRAAELRMKEFAREHPEMRLCAVRFGNVLGSSGSIVPKFLRQIRNREPLTITHKDMTRYFMSIPEAVSLIHLAWIVAKSGQILVLDMGEPIRILDLATTLARLHGLVPEKDISIIETGIRPGEKLHEQLAHDDASLTPTDAERVFVAEEL